MPRLAPLEQVHFLHRAIRYRTRTERQELSYLMSRGLKGRTAVDIGAHRGIFSYWMRRAVGPKGRVISFEPQPEMLAALTRMRETFRIRNMDIVDSGLSDTPGEAILRRVDGHTGGASVEHPDEAEPNSEDFSISLTTLDDAIAELDADPVAFIKCDVEGHEQAVFRGARRTLTEDRPHLLFECHDDYARDGAIFRDLEQIGYRGWFLDGRRKVPVERFANERDQIDRPYLNFVFEPTR